MAAPELPHKPLVEAVFELRIRLGGSGAPGFGKDPDYALQLGRFFERVGGDYPFHEGLPTIAIPEDIAGHTIQHRFRAGENAWPLLQIGPGILTVNDTTGYKWEHFHKHCTGAIEKYVDSRSTPCDLHVEALILRYINAVDCDPASEDITEFLATKMQVKFDLPDTLFASGAVEKKPTALTAQVSYQNSKPRSIVTVRFATGRRLEVPALVWETVVTSRDDDVPTDAKHFGSWLSDAHDVAEDWFLKLIDGELLRRFSTA